MNSWGIRSDFKILDYAAYNAMVLCVKLIMSRIQNTGWNSHFSPYVSAAQRCKVQRWKKRGMRGTPSVLIFSSCAIFFDFHNFCCTILCFCTILLCFCKFFQNVALFCSFIHIYAYFCTCFCANISSSKILSVLFFTLFPTLAK